MQTRELLSRRAVLRLLGALGLGALGLPSCGSELDEPDVRQTFGALLPRTAGALSIGRRFLREHPEEADVATLVDALSLPRNPHDLEAAPHPAMRARLATTHEEDFRRGRVVELGGWVFSRTEARLAALASLLEAR